MFTNRTKCLNYNNYIDTAIWFLEMADEFCAKNKIIAPKLQSRKKVRSKECNNNANNKLTKDLKFSPN